MLCCGAEIGIFVFGIITLIKGTFTLSKTRVVQGTPARFIGALLLLPLIAGQGGELLVGIMWGLERGMKGQPANMMDAMQEAARELQVKALIINGIALGVPLLAALVIALSTAKPPPKKKRPRDDDDDLDDDDDDRPRRRRPARDDDDEAEVERPRRRPARTDEDPGDDRIRRRKGPNDD